MASLHPKSVQHCFFATAWHEWAGILEGESDHSQLNPALNTFMKAAFEDSFWAPIKETFDWWASTILVKWQGGCYQVTPRYLVKFVYKMDLSIENFSQHPSVGFPEVFLLPNHVRISSSSQTFRDGKEKNWQNFDQSFFASKTFHLSTSLAFSTPAPSSATQQKVSGKIMLTFFKGVSFWVLGASQETTRNGSSIWLKYLTKMNQIITSETRAVVEVQL